jgi:hypothetical protein
VIPPSGKCVWSCNSGRPFNREHIIAQQVADAMGMPFPVRISWGDIRRSTGEETERGDQTKNQIEIVFDDRVCERCNNKWMKKLDDQMLAFMRPMLESETPVQIDPSQRLTLARWATKIGLLLALYLHDQPLADADSETMGKGYAPADNFTALYVRSMTVPDHTQVWVGMLDPAVEVSESEVSVLTIPVHGTPGPVGYYVLFSLKRLVFFVAGLELAYATPSIGDWVELEQRLADSRAMVQIWPSDGSAVSLPPPSYLEPSDLFAMVKEQPHGG